MTVYEEHGVTIIDMGAFKIRVVALDAKTLDLNLMDNKGSCIKVVPAAGNVIRISPDQ